MANIKRISKEYQDLEKTPIPGITINIPDESNLSLWHVTLTGPPSTPYANGKFGLKIELPPTYPFAAPKVTFFTRIYHPNVTCDTEGNICIGLLKPDQWKPASKMAAVLAAVRQLLIEPNPDDPLETRIAEEYTKEKPKFEKQAAEYTKKYASASNPFA
ncbi:hypothetical protein N0V82_001278 [Gnomoniopsis sp. IMI 355080]|nr:hypothetical protein N0V82_001278 [Gnomoniopsis sp. IMI 355080]